MKRAGLLAATLALTACAAERPVATVAPAPAAMPAKPPEGMQYLYGSAEAAALSEQAYNALVDQVRRTLAARTRHEVGTRLSAVLAPDTNLADPRFVDCGDKPPAAVFDMDETAVLNLGYEANDAEKRLGYDAARWRRWEETGADAVVAVPGAREAFAALRAMGVTVVLNTNRSNATAPGSVRAAAVAGLGDFIHGDTLFLKGDVDGKSGKDGRRAAIAARFCVVALGGDQLGDFSDLFAGADPVARRSLAMSPAVRGLWGRGWFVLPNPVYGTGLGATFDQTFPTDRRWADPAASGGK